MAKTVIYYKEVTSREALNRHGDCASAHERNEGCIYCYVKMCRYPADELTGCSNFVRSRFRTVERGENPVYGRVKTPKRG